MEEHKKPTQLRNAHVQGLLATFRHIDGLLAQIEDILRYDSTLALPIYEPDVPEELKSRVECKIEDFRSLMLSILARQQIAVSAPHISASHALETIADFVPIAIDELRPNNMLGHGALSETQKHALGEIANELDSFASDVDSFCETGGKASCLGT